MSDMNLTPKLGHFLQISAYFDLSPSPKLAILDEVMSPLSIRPLQLESGE